MNTRAKKRTGSPVKRWPAALSLATASALVTLGLTPLAAQAADGPFGAIEDAGLAECINKTLDSTRPATRPISDAELAGLLGPLLCNSGTGIKSFAGFEAATRVRVVRLVGKQHQLTDATALDGLGQAPGVTTIGLESIGLTNAAFTGLSSATALTNLSVTKTDGLSDLTPISALPILRTLDLSHDRQLSDLSPIAALTTLTALTIQNSGVVNLEPVVELVNLTSLAAANTDITSLLPLKKLTKLTTLNMVSTKLTTLDGIEDLRLLRQGYFRYAPLAGSIEALRGKPELRILDIDGTGTTSLEPLRASVSLTSLRAVGNFINSLVGLMPNPNAVPLQVTQQSVTGPPQYVPVGAATFRMNAAGQVTLRDGVTFPPLVEVNNPPVQPIVDPDLNSLLTFTVRSGANTLFYNFLEGSGANAFGGRVTLPIVPSSITSTDRLTGTVGSPIEHTVTVTEGFPTEMFTIGDSSPEWLSINPDTGKFGGSPNEPGTYTVPVQASDALGNTITQAVTITVNPQESAAVQLVSDQHGTAGEPLTFTVTRLNDPTHPWTGAISVDVSTEAGSAIESINYTHNATTLIWAEGELGPKTFTVQTAPAPRGAPASEKSFTVQLSHPGAHTVLGVPSSVRGTIVTEASANPPSPSPSPTAETPSGTPTAGPTVGSGAGATTPPLAARPNAQPGGLPATGSEGIVSWALGGAILLLALGGALLGRRRRHDAV